MNWSEMIAKRKEQESQALIPKKTKMALSAYEVETQRALFQLSPLERQAIILRFVRPEPIARVADGMGMSWDGADELIDRAVRKIQQIFIMSQERRA